MPGIGVGVAVGLGARPGLTLPGQNLIAAMLGGLGVDTDAGPPITAETWSSQFVTGPYATDGTKSKQPGYDGTTLSFNGTSNILTFNDLTSVSTSYTIVLVAALAIEAGSNTYVFYSPDGGRVAFGRRSTGELAIYDTSAHLLTGTTAALAKSVWSIRLNGGTSTMTTRINGVNKTLDDSSWDALVIDGACEIGGHSGSYFCETDLSALVIYDALLSDGVLQQVERWLAVRYGVAL